MRDRHRRADRFMRLRDVCGVAAISSTTVYDLIAKGKFPKPVHVEPTIVRWSFREVQGWVRDMKLKRDARLKPVDD